MAFFFLFFLRCIYNFLKVLLTALEEGLSLGCACACVCVCDISCSHLHQSEVNINVVAASHVISEPG